MVERLQKLLAKAGHGSRRKCESLIVAGRVRVNGQVARLGTKADPNLDLVEVDNKPISFEKALYIMLNKPVGVLSSTEDELDQGRPTVRGLVEIPGHFYPVGRLDKQSEGLILLTNDGELAHRLTHPRYGHEKLYRIKVEGHIAERNLDQWRNGLLLDDRMTAPAKVEVIKQTDENTLLYVTLREGRKRQIRRVAAALDHPVNQLVRLRIGPIRLSGVAPGKWRHLTDDEVRSLRHSLGLAGDQTPEDHVDV